MNVAELMEILEDLEPETIVRVAFQPNWPFEYGLGDQSAIVDGDMESPPVLYLAAVDQVGYLPGDVAEEIGWS